MRTARRHVRVTAAVAIGLTLVLVACGDDDDGVDVAATAPPTGSVDTGAVETAVDPDAVDTVLSTTTAVVTTTTDPEPTTTAAPTTSTTQLATSWLREGAFADQAFGTGTLDAAVAVASDELGEPVDDTVVECDGGTAQQVRWEVLTLSGDPSTGAVTGWYYGGGEPSLLGPLGIGLGTTVAELRALVPTVEVFESTLGPEFVWTSTDGQIVGGFLAGVDDDSTVTAFYAGFLCAFR